MAEAESPASATFRWGYALPVSPHAALGLDNRLIYKYSIEYLNSADDAAPRAVLHLR